MMNSKLISAINLQINREIYSSYLYAAMAIYAEFQHLNGVAHWFKVQTDEEWNHAQLFIQHLLDRNILPDLLQIDKPPREFDGIIDLFKQSYIHEQKITANINDLNHLSDEIQDYNSTELLRHFANEQVEEESMFLEILSLLEASRGNWAALLEIDAKLGERNSK